MSFAVYFLISACQRYTYVGATTDFSRRLRQHKGEIKGGSSYCLRLLKSGVTWEPFIVVTGFSTWKEALQFEVCQKNKLGPWRTDNTNDSTRTILNAFKGHYRIKNLIQTLWLEKWTKNATVKSTLTITFYHLSPSDIDTMLPKCNIIHLLS